MKSPSLESAIIMYAIDIGILWTATRILSPEDNKPSILRCFCVAFALTFLGNASRHYLTPLIGYWVILVCFAIYFLIMKGFFRLSLWRSGLVALIFYVGFLVQYFFLFRETTK
jgi:hypothetical protein